MPKRLMSVADMTATLEKVIKAASDPTKKDEDVGVLLSAMPTSSLVLLMCQGAMSGRLNDTALERIGGEIDVRVPRRLGG